MIIPDANLLLYAVDQKSPFHTESKTWLEGIMNQREAVGLCHPVVFAFIRLSTHRKIFENPLRLDEAFGYVESWLERPHCRQIQPGPSHLQTVKQQLRAANSSGGNLVTDAQIAAIAREMKATVHTADRDFLRFEGIRIVVPIS